MSDRRILSPGEEFEKYVIERELGHGGMGAVYLVRHRILDTEYALKVLYPEVAKSDKQYVERFIREGRLAGQIRHQNLIAVYDAGQNEKNGMYYLVMDYVAGGSVRDKLKKQHYVDMMEAISIVRQVASALQAAQNHNMVHRDIKPDNIMFDEKGVVRLADLGIAKATDDRDTGLTLEASVFGTPAYMSPEQARDSSKVDTRADIYSLGVVFYEMLTGRRPFGGDTAMEILSHVIDNVPAPDVRTFSKDVPADVAKLVADMLEKDKEKRIANPTELLRRVDELDLSAYQDGAGAADEADVTMPTMATPLGEPTASSAPPEPPRTDVTLPTMASPVSDAPSAPASEQPAQKLNLKKESPAPDPTLVQAPAAASPKKQPSAKVEATLVMTDEPKPSHAVAGAGKGNKTMVFAIVGAVVFLCLAGGIGLVLSKRGKAVEPAPNAPRTEVSGTELSGGAPQPPVAQQEAKTPGVTVPETTKPVAKTTIVEKAQPQAPTVQTVQAKETTVSSKPSETAPSAQTVAPVVAEAVPETPQTAQTPVPVVEQTNAVQAKPAEVEPPQTQVATAAVPQQSSGGLKRLGSFEEGGVVIFGADNGNTNSLYRELSKMEALKSVGFQVASKDLKNWGSQISEIQGNAPAFVIVVITQEKNGFQFKRMLQGLVKMFPANKAMFLVCSSDPLILDEVREACNPTGMTVYNSVTALTSDVLDLKKELKW